VIIGHVISEFIRAVCKLALLAIGAVALICKIPAERSLDFGGTDVMGISWQCFGLGMQVYLLSLLALGGDI
jgi:hypothetical protein